MDLISPEDLWKVLAFCGAAIIIGGIYFCLKRNKNEEEEEIQEPEHEQRQPIQQQITRNQRRNKKRAKNNDKGRFSYQIIDNDERTATVWFEGEGAEGIHSTFITMDKKAALDCYFWPRHANNSSILPPIGIAKHPISEEWFVFYESFSLFSTWAALNDDERLQSASNLLKALEQLDRLQLALNPMENHGNYVVCRNEIRLINITSNPTGLRQDIEGLSEIFGLMLPTFRPTERRMFISYVRETALLGKIYNKRVRKAIKYPYLRSSKARVRCCFDIYMRITNHIVPGPETFKLSQFDAYKDWEIEQMPHTVSKGHHTWIRKRSNKNRIRNQTSTTLAQVDDKDYNNNKVWGLVAFLRNLYAHDLNTEAELKEVDNYITDKLPGFLCILHETYPLGD